MKVARPIQIIFEKRNGADRHTDKRGFTLIEMMVSVSLFLVVMVISLGAVYAIINGNKKTQAIIAVSNNLNYTIESMVRDIKTGYFYTCGTPTLPLDKNTTYAACDTTKQNVITFISRITGQDLTVRYEFKTINGRGVIEKTFCPITVILAQSVTGCESSTVYTPVAITSPDINVDTTISGFYVKKGEKSPTPGDQPAVFIMLKGTAAINQTSASDFSIQTYVSQRILNI